LVFSLFDAPAGASIGASTGTFTWNPAEAQGPGDYTFKVRVSDGVTLTERTITIHVTEVNQAPVLAPIGNQSVNEESTLSITLSATDVDRVNPNQTPNTLHYCIVSGGQSGMSLNPTTGAFSWTPGEAQDGEYDVVFRVTDGKGGSAEVTVRIAVSEVNQA